MQEQSENLDIDSVAEINVKANGVVDKTTSKEEIKSAINSADIEIATLSLESKGDDIVVVLDPGHGG